MLVYLAILLYRYGTLFPSLVAISLVVYDRLLYPFRKWLPTTLRKHYSRAFPFSNYCQYIIWFRLLKKIEQLPYIRKGMNDIGMKHLTEWHFLNLRDVVVPSLDFKNLPSTFTHPQKFPPFFLPGLASEEFPSVENACPELYLFEQKFAAIKDEIFGVMNSSIAPLQYTGEDGKAYENWQVNYLYFNEQPNETILSRMPVTRQLLDSLSCIEKTMVMISILQPGVPITPHVGVTNAILRGLFPVKVPADAANCYIRVGEKTGAWEEGRLMILDDTYEHEVFNNTNETRVTLFFNIWHPQLCAEGKDLHRQMISHLLLSRTYGSWKEFQVQ